VPHKRQRRRRGGCEMRAVLLIAVMALCGGCRTYYVYQFGFGDNEILVDADVEKAITPTVKASLQ